MVERGVLAELFPEAGPELIRLLESAAENSGLLRSDYYTLRDWLELADYCNHASLPALLLILLLALDEGSFCVEWSEQGLARRLVDLVGPEEASAWAQKISADLDQDPCPRLIGSNPREPRPVILQDAHGRRYLYFQKYLRAEQLFQERLARRMSAPLPAWDPDRVRQALREVLHDKPLRHPSGQALALDREQLWALGVALARPQAIISGGPGTGKTSIVLTLLRCLVRSGIAPDRIALAAPTGRAAQRLGEALQAGLGSLASGSDADESLRTLSAGTLHALLGYRPNRNIFTRHIENPIPADVVIVDEVSMIGLVLMAQLLGALDPATRLILLGDKDQLPSVDAGAVLSTLVDDDELPRFGSDLAGSLAAAWPEVDWPVGQPRRGLDEQIVILRTNHRSQADIRSAAAAINAQDTDLVDRLPALRLEPDGWLASGQGCWLLEQVQASPAELRGFLHAWIEHAYFRHREADGPTAAELVQSFASAKAAQDDLGQQQRLRALFKLLDGFRLLTLVRDGPWGCDAVNRACALFLQPRLDPEARGGVFAGSLVLINRNDPGMGLFNGDVGVALPGSDGLRVTFPRGSDFLSYPVGALPAHELGFALTVHKSQGSEYGRVMAILPPEGGRRLLTKELLYTAITRARQLAILCGTRPALRYAIGRRVLRESGNLVLQ